MDLVTSLLTALYSLWIGSAIVTFLAIYFVLLVILRRRDMPPEAAVLPTWLNLLHPPLLDSLTLGDLVTGFALALPLSIAFWTIGAVCVLMVVVAGLRP